MRTFDLVMYILAALCFVAEALISTRPTRPTPLNFIPLGLLFWVLVPLVTLARN